MKIDERSILETLTSTTLTIDDSFHRKYTKVSGKNFDESIASFQN